MSKKTTILLVLGLVVLIIIAIFLALTMDKTSKGKQNESNSNEDSNSNIVTNEKDSIVIDYKTYQELRSEVHESETFAIVIMNSEDKISQTFKEEVVYSFREKKAKIYEIDVNKIDELEYSGIIDDVTKIMKYDKPGIVIPTILISKKGKIVYKHAGLIYSPELSEELEKNKIE